MKRKHIQFLLSAVVVLMGAAGCALPGQGTQPASDSNLNTISTTIAGTVRAAATVTALAEPVETRAPGRTGTAIEQAEDGTTKYSDYDGGFEVTYPAGWLSVRPNSEEFDAALANEAAVNTMLYDQMNADLSEHDEFDRLYAYIIRPDLEDNVIFGFSTLSWDPDDPAPIDSVSLGKLVRELESASSGLPGFRADTVQLHEDGDIKMAEIGGHWMMSDGQGGTIPFYTTGIYFKPTSSTTARMNFTYLENVHVPIATDIITILASIRLIE